MNFSPNSLKGFIQGIIIEVFKGDAKSLGIVSYELQQFEDELMVG